MSSLNKSNPTNQHAGWLQGSSELDLSGYPPRLWWTYVEHHGQYKLVSIWYRRSIVYDRLQTTRTSSCSVHGWRKSESLGWNGHNGELLKSKSRDIHYDITKTRSDSNVHGNNPGLDLGREGRFNYYRIPYVFEIPNVIKGRNHFHQCTIEFVVETSKLISIFIVLRIQKFYEILLMFLLHRTRKFQLYSGHSTKQIDGMWNIMYKYRFNTEASNGKSWWDIFAE